MNLIKVVTTRFRTRFYKAKWKSLVTFVFAVLLGGSAEATLVLTTTNQTGSEPFTPAWSRPRTA